MSAVRRGSLAAALSLAVLRAPEALAEEPLPIVALGHASALGVGSTGAPAGWIALPKLSLAGSPRSVVDLRPIVELDALDLACGAVAPVLRLDLRLGVAGLSVDWSPYASLGGHARLTVTLD
jgi:hypothetical protein